MNVNFKKMVKVLTSLVILFLAFVIIYKLSYANFLDIRNFNPNSGNSLFTVNGLIHFKSVVMAIASLVPVILIFLASLGIEKIFANKSK